MATSRQTSMSTAGGTPTPNFITPLSNDPHPKTYSKFSAADVSTHNTETSLWIIANGNVYDVTTFSDEHPGGKKIMQSVAGKDATKQVNKYHRPVIIKRHESQLKVGEIVSEVPKKGFGRLFGFGKK